MVLKNKQHRNNGFLIALGDAVRNRRVDLLITQAALAGSAQLHRTYITEIEAGQRNLSMLTLLRIAKALDIPLSELIHAAEGHTVCTGESGYNSGLSHSLEMFTRFLLKCDDVILEESMTEHHDDDQFRSNYGTLLGLIFLELKQHSEARDAFSRSILLSPTSAAYCGLGISLVQTNEYESAIDSFQTALRIDPDNEYDLKWLNWATHLHGHAIPGPGCRHCVQQSADKKRLNMQFSTSPTLDEIENCREKLIKTIKEAEKLGYADSKELRVLKSGLKSIEALRESLLSLKMGEAGSRENAQKTEDPPPPRMTTAPEEED